MRMLLFDRMVRDALENAEGADAIAAKETLKHIVFVPHHEAGMTFEELKDALKQVHRNGKRSHEDVKL